MANTTRRTFARAIVVAACVLSALMVGPAAASPDRFDAGLRDAVARLTRARGAEAYVALRRLWDTWDRSDPTQVEAYLEAAAEDRSAPPGVRAYAATLTAYARLRRGDVATARRRIAELGFVDDWLVVGPFDNDGKAGLPLEQGPELDFARAIVPGRAYSGKEGPVRWRRVPEGAFPFGWLDTGALVRPAENVCVYATTFVQHRSGKATAASAWLGTSGAFRLYLNGLMVLEDPKYRGHDSGRHAVTLDLRPGPNNLTLKVCGEDEAPVVSLRLADRLGNPDGALEATADLALSEAAARHAAALAEAKAAPPSKAALVGPLAELEQRIRAKQPAAADLFAYAEYLVYTSSDDQTEHLARDHARRAAELEPTVERLLLAGLLAEDRNQEAEWLAKAAAQAAKDGRESVDVLLAQASHARGGVSWREAFPYLDRALALDPGNVGAIRGRVELYNEAGLRRTALATLERALTDNPTSVNLLNMYASQLTALGRTTEAAEVAERYAALRFDDRSHLAGKIELAIARRDGPAAERWITRLLSVAPDSQWALGVAARSYRRLGQPGRAIATYERALALAPEDVGTLRTLADLHGELGMRQEQLALLRTILKLRPQERDVREYLDHIEPPRARPDEAYAWAADKFLHLRGAPARGQNRRTLRDLTVTTVYPNGKSSKFRQVVYQPLTDAAAASLRQYAFQYEADREVVQLRGARVFRKDGKVDEAIEYGEGAADLPWISMYTSARTFYIQLPRLEPGDVVEIKYRVDDTTPRDEFADYFGEVVYLQSSEPVANAEYVLIAPESRQLHLDTNLKGLSRTEKKVGKSTVYRFFAKSIAPLDVEPAMPPLQGVIGHVHVSTYTDYGAMGRWYWGLSKDQLELDDATRELARKLGAGAKTDLDKVRAVFNWVVKNTRYVALEFGIYGYKPRRAVQTVARGWGDCKDKATVIVALLKELGVKATVVVVRTQNRGDFTSKVASLAPFDHAIAYVPSLDLYLDGTAEYSGATELPAGDLEALGLRINEGQAEVVRLPGNDPKANVVRRTVRADLARDGSAQLALDYKVTGTSAPGWRLLYHAESTRRERIQTTLVGTQYPGFELAPGPGGVKTNDLEDLDQPVTLAIQGKAPSFARREGDLLSVAVLPTWRLTPAYASLPKRRYDVRMLGIPATDDTYVVRLPAGLKTVTLPPEAAATTPFGSYSVQVTQKGAEVTVTSHFELTASRVTPAQYADWQRFCNAVDSAFSHRLLVGP